MKATHAAGPTHDGNEGITMLLVTGCAAFFLKKI